MEESPVIRAVRQKVQDWIDAGDSSKRLNLSSMNVTELPVDIFAGCSQLTSISLNDNRLTELPTGLFAECSKLKYIDLSYNQELYWLPTNLFAECLKLEYVSFDYILIYEVLWVLPKIDVYCDCSGKKLIKKFPFECALIKKYRRVADDTRSYAWDVRRFVLLSDPSDFIWCKRAHAVVIRDGLCPPYHQLGTDN